MPLQVVQWTTGIVGRAALRAIIAHPELELVTGKYYKDDAGARLEKAAQTGGASLFGTGMNPLFISTLALAATAMCGTVKKISMLESLDCVMYEGAETWKAYGFGQPLDHDRMKQDLWDAEPDYRELLDVVATSLRGPLRGGNSGGFNLDNQSGCACMIAGTSWIVITDTQLPPLEQRSRRIRRRAGRGRSVGLLQV